MQSGYGRVASDHGPDGTCEKVLMQPRLAKPKLLIW